jgi:hypothetical protein
LLPLSYKGIVRAIHYGGEIVAKKSDVYQICVQGYLKANWTEWLQSVQVKHKRNGVTILTGQIIDQSALQGLLDYLFDMGITLLSLKRVDTHPKMDFLHHPLFHLIYLA